MVKVVGSGVNDSRPKLLSLLRDPMITRLVVEPKDRLTRFSFRYIETPLEIQGRTIEVAGAAENNKKTCCTIWQVSSTRSAPGKTRHSLAKRKAERLVEQLESKDGQE